MPHVRWVLFRAQSQTLSLRADLFGVAISWKRNDKLFLRPCQNYSLKKHGQCRAFLLAFEIAFSFWNDGECRLFFADKRYVDVKHRAFVFYAVAFYRAKSARRSANKQGLCPKMKNHMLSRWVTLLRFVNPILGYYMKKDRCLKILQQKFQNHQLYKLMFSN